MILRKKFFDRPTLTVAQELLGKYLVKKCPSTSLGRRRARVVAAMITEVEVYDGPRDKASHASRGLTKRNAPMFGPAGRWYVYFTYGMHWMLNVVTREKGYPAAVLIRSVQFLEVKPLSEVRPRCIDGPAKITKFFKIDKRLNGKLATKQNSLWLEDRGVKINKRQIEKRGRIGVNYAGSMWANKKWNFAIFGGETSEIY